MNVLHVVHWFWQLLLGYIDSVVNAIVIVKLLEGWSAQMFWGTRCLAGYLGGSWRWSTSKTSFQTITSGYSFKTKNTEDHLRQVTREHCCLSAPSDHTQLVVHKPRVSTVLRATLQFCCKKSQSFLVRTFLFNWVGQVTHQCRTSEHKVPFRWGQNVPFLQLGYGGRGLMKIKCSWHMGDDSYSKGLVAVEFHCKKVPLKKSLTNTVTNTVAGTRVITVSFCFAVLLLGNMSATGCKTDLT